MITQAVDGVPVRLREPHDLSFLQRWGRTFCVFDDQDSGNLCFGVQSADGALFVKYAGAPTLRYEGESGQAVDRLRRAVSVYRALAHPSLVRLREAVEDPGGYALVFDWSDGVSLGRQYGQRARLDGLSVEKRAEAIQQILDFHVEVAARGWVAIDLYDGSILIDLDSGVVTLCDLDFYEPAPVANTMGRMWGSSRFMSPEELTLGAPIDEVTNIFALGALAHTLLGDDATKLRSAWRGTEDQYMIAATAMQPVRQDRWPSITRMADAWRNSLA